MMSRIPYWMHCWTVWQCHQLSELRIGNVPLEWCPMKDEYEFVVNLSRVILRIQEFYIILSTKWTCTVVFSADRSIFWDWRVRYKDEDHVGYDIGGEKIMRTPQSDVTYLQFSIGTVYIFAIDLDPARTLSTSEIDALLESKVWFRSWFHQHDQGAQADSKDFCMVSLQLGNFPFRSFQFQCWDCIIHWHPCSINMYFFHSVCEMFVRYSHLTIASWEFSAGQSWCLAHHQRPQEPTRGFTMPHVKS